MRDHEEKQPYIWVNSFNEDDVRSFYNLFFELEANARIPVIIVFIDSYGGNANGLFAMRDLIKSSEKPVATVCIGKAMSAGACLLAAGHPNLRFISKDADIMIHEVSSGFEGKNQEMQSASKWTDKLNHKLIKNLAEDMGVYKKDIDDQLKKVKNADWYLTPKEAKKWGLVDHIEIPRILYHDAAVVLAATKPIR